LTCVVVLKTLWHYRASVWCIFYWLDVDRSDRRVMFRVKTTCENRFHWSDANIWM